MGQIIVTLPRRRKGGEILEAFRNASSFQEKEDCRWSARLFSAASGVITPETTYEGKKGVYAVPLYRRRQNRVSRKLFGERPDKWVARECDGELLTKITLHPVLPSEEYDSVELSVQHAYGCDAMACEIYLTRTPDENFDEMRPAYDRIIREFMAKLS